MEKYILIKNYFNDNVVCAFSSDLEEVRENLNQDLLKLSEWFFENYTILNPDKCHYIFLGKNTISGLLQYCGEYLKGNERETVLAKEIDSKLSIKLSILKNYGH